MNIALTNQYKHPLYSTNCEFYNILYFCQTMKIMLNFAQSYKCIFGLGSWILVVSSDVLQTIV